MSGRAHRLTLAALATCGAVVAAGMLAVGAQSHGVEDACGLPVSRPLWIEYGEGSVPPPVREVFQRPGVIVAASGTFLPPQYREQGAKTTYWVLKLPKLVGDPSTPADPATIQRAADTTYNLAVKSTLCATPWIALNELAGPAAPVPWTGTTRQYRANVLALVRRLAERGAHPVLLIHGNPTVAGEATEWWRDVAGSADLVYEAYYNASNLSRLGRILGPRRVRLGIRSVVRLYAGLGIPRERLGVMLGFQVAPGKSGREGLQPSQAWYRVVKWEALAARQVAAEEGISSIWSWGWGNLGPQAADPDKPNAACVYLWARDQKLCDGKTAAGAGFNASLVEGPIAVPAGFTCISVLGKLPTKSVDELAKLTRSRQVALDGLFARSSLSKRFKIDPAAIDAVEQETIGRAFAGSRDAYLAELKRRNATQAVARGIVGDELRRRAIAASAAPGTTALSVAADASGFAADTATCLKDLVPGTGDFPRSDRRELGGVPLPAYLPFIFDDRTAPAAPGTPTAVASGATVTLDWPDSPEPDLTGYLVVRTVAGAAPVTLTRAPLARSELVDRAVPVGGAVSYVVQTVDTSGNPSAPSAPVTPVAG